MSNRKWWGLVLNGEIVCVKPSHTGGAPWTVADFDSCDIPLPHGCKSVIEVAVKPIYKDRRESLTTIRKNRKTGLVEVKDGKKVVGRQG